MKNILLIIVAILFCGTAQAATYYASPTGSGTTCSEAAPCTLSYTLVTKISSNDMVKVLPGTYTISSQITQKSGTTGIIVEGSDSTNIANWPVLDGSGITTGRMIYSYGGTFRFLKVKNVGRAVGYTKFAFIADDNAPNVTVEHVIASNCGGLMEYKGASNIIRYNYVYRTAYGSIGDNGIDAGETVDIYRNIFNGGPWISVGVATSGDTDTLVDTATTWSNLGIFSGAVIKNYTDGSWGIVKSWTGNTVEFVSDMSSGSWAAGDRWELYGGNASSAENNISITGAATFNIRNNTFSSPTGASIRVLAGMSGSTAIKNNMFLSVRAGYNINSSAASGVSVNNNLYLNETFAFTGNLTGVTDAGISTSTNWGVRPNVDFTNPVYFSYRFDDSYYGVCADCTDNYYLELAKKMQPYGASGVIGIDVAEVGKTGYYLTWEDIRTLVNDYGWEMASHSLSHQSVDVTTRKTSPFSVTGPGSIVIAMSGSPPNDSGTITITEGANSLVITLPALPNLVYTAQRTTGSDNDPWDYTVVNTGMPSSSAYDLGSFKGLRDYIDSLTNWTATAFDGDTDFPENAPTRELASGTYNAPSSTPLLFSAAAFNWWELKYSKDVIDTQIGNGYNTTSFIYPNFVLDHAAISALQSYGYNLGMGYTMKNGQNLLDSFSAFNFGTYSVASYKSTDADTSGTGGEEYDIRHFIRALTNGAAGDNRAVGLISHDRSDVLSMSQWDWIISEVAAQPFVEVKTAKELADIITGSGLWTSVAGGKLWERDYSDVRNLPTLLSTSPAINAGTR